MNEIVEIMPNMFLGTANATNSHVLARFGIQCVLNVATKRDFLNDGTYVRLQSKQDPKLIFLAGTLQKRTPPF
jgi:hypothetical protein